MSAVEVAVLVVAGVVLLLVVSAGLIVWATRDDPIPLWWKSS